MEIIMHEINEMYPDDKKELYQLLNAQLKALLDNETNLLPNLSNAAALIAGALKDINWAGFYLIQNNELLLGPFQGKPACVHIPIGKGVCGTAVSRNETQLVSDVHEFPGHIACDSASRSEIVIPLRDRDRIVGVLDIDSPLLARFDEDDRNGLEEFAEILTVGTEWS
jgi:GAF domain-containing protein